MKKFWETERVGAHIFILCRVIFADGRRGGVQRCVGYWQWNEMNKFAQHAYLSGMIQVMNFDIERLIK